MRKLPQYLSQYQLQQLRNHMPTNMTKDMITVMYAFALRISELCNLRKEDIDWYNEVITINGKGSKIRQLPITENVKDILHLACMRPGKLFNYEVRTFRNYVYHASLKSGMERVNPHMVRHTRATHLMNAGVQLHDIKAIMRHESISSTLIYTHVALDRMRTLMQ